MQTQLSESKRHRPRLVLLAFLVTFITARILVIAIMARWMPDLFLHVGQTHVHHLNYGIFILSALCAYLLFAQPGKKALDRAALLYGVGLALTFDEFGMWIHLGGGYWQRASFDAVCVIAAILGLIAYAPPPRQWRPKYWTAAVGVTVLVAIFFALLVRTFHMAGDRYGPRLQQLEEQGPP